MKRDPIDVFRSDEDESRVADLSDLFPCAAFGVLPAEALAEVLAAREAWLETARELDLPIPEATYRPDARRAAG